MLSCRMPGIGRFSWQKHRLIYPDFLPVVFSACKYLLVQELFLIWKRKVDWICNVYKQCNMLVIHQGSIKLRHNIRKDCVLVCFEFLTSQWVFHNMYEQQAENTPKTACHSVMSARKPPDNESIYVKYCMITTQIMSDSTLLEKYNQGNTNFQV